MPRLQGQSGWRSVLLCVVLFSLLPPPQGFPPLPYLPSSVPPWGAAGPKGTAPRPGSPCAPDAGLISDAAASQGLGSERAGIILVSSRVPGGPSSQACALGREARSEQAPLPGGEFSQGGRLETIQNGGGGSAVAAGQDGTEKGGLQNLW